MLSHRDVNSPNIPGFADGFDNDSGFGLIDQPRIVNQARELEWHTAALIDEIRNVNPVVFLRQTA
jgi:hypothetical protein